MNRENEIAHKMLTFSIANMIQRSEQIEKDFQEHIDEYTTQILKAFDELFLSALKLQQEEQKGPINYINIYFLNSTYVKGSYECLIEMYDEEFLLDKKPVSIQFVPKFVSKFYEQDWKKYEEFMNKAVIQVRYHELQEYRLELTNQYQKILREIFATYIPYIIHLRSYRNMAKEDTLKIGFGEYGSQGVILYETGKEELEKREEASNDVGKESSLDYVEN